MTHAEYTVNPKIIINIINTINIILTYLIIPEG